MKTFRICGIDNHGTQQQLSTQANHEADAVATFRAWMRLELIVIKKILSVVEVEVKERE